MKPSILSCLSGLGMILVGIFSVIWGINYGSNLSLILIGFLAWTVSVGLKFVWAALTNKKIIDYFKKKLSSKFSGPITWTYIGMLTGIFECGISLIFVFLVPSLFNADWHSIVGFGIGFGAFESLIVGLMVILGNLYFLIKPSAAPNNALKRYRQYPFTAISIPIIERAATIPIHTFTKILVVLSVQQNMYYLFLLSFFFKSVVDSVAAWSHFKLDITNWKKPKQILGVELIIVVFGALSILGIFWLSNV